MNVFADLTLARRLERAESLANARFVEARARLAPGSGAAWVDVAGTYAMFDGASSPLTQTFGFGLFEPPASRDLDTIERFFAERSAPVFHEVSPLADPEHMALLSQRGYHPIELTTVLYRPVLDHEIAPAAPDIVVRRVQDGEQDLWARTAALGWSDTAGLDAFMLDVGRVSAARADTVLFIAELDGRPVATGALAIGDGIALLAGASTVPGARARGAQLALLATRLSVAADSRCELAMMGALPGSGSQRNAERHGFRVAYTRTKWALTAGSDPGRPADGPR